MLGSYLALFMWTRICKINGVDPFQKILSDIAEFYDPNEWRDFADAELFVQATTERKHRQALKKGVDLVSFLGTIVHVLFVYFVLFLPLNPAIKLAFDFFYY